jgi:hypothetical protein
MKLLPVTVLELQNGRLAYVGSQYAEWTAQQLNAEIVARVGHSESVVLQQVSQSEQRQSLGLSGVSA